MPPRNAPSQNRRRDHDDDEDGGRSGPLSDEELRALAAQLVRLALFQEYDRQPLRRDTIRKLVISKAPRSFNEVFQLAQDSLRDTFGMELVELRVKRKGDVDETQQSKRKGKQRADAEEGDGEDAEDGEANTQTQAKSVGSKSYTLRSVLPSALLAEMSRPAPLPDFGEEDDPAQPELARDSGALIRWEKADGSASGSVGLLGVRTVILSLILCLGRVVQDDQLHALLRRLNLGRETVLPYQSPDSKEPPLTLDKYLDLLAKQSYLEKVKVPGPHGTAEGGTIEWRWGSREAEFSEKAAAAFIEKLFIDEADSGESSEEEDDHRRRGRNQNGDDDENDDRHLSRAERKERARKKLRLDLQRAAGGSLAGEL